MKLLAFAVLVFTSTMALAQDVPLLTEQRVLAKIGILTLQVDALNEQVAALKTKIAELEIENKKLKEKEVSTLKE